MSKRVRSEKVEEIIHSGMKQIKMSLMNNDGVMADYALSQLENELDRIGTSRLEDVAGIFGKDGTLEIHRLISKYPLTRSAKERWDKIYSPLKPSPELASDSSDGDDSDVIYKDSVSSVEGFTPEEHEFVPVDPEDVDSGEEGTVYSDEESASGSGSGSGSGEEGGNNEEDENGAAGDEGGDDGDEEDEEEDDQEDHQDPGSDDS